MKHQNVDYQIEFAKGIMILAAIFGTVGSGILLGFLVTGEGIMLYVGTLFSLAWGVVIVIIYHRVSQQRLYQSGISLMTKYEAIVDKKGDPITDDSSEKNVYYIQTSWHDTASNTIYLFKSEVLFKNPEAYLKDITGINVYVDPQNFMRNYMDLQFLPRHFNVRRMP